MEEPKIFYSWQSDHPGLTNRNLIEESLEKAIKLIKLDDSPIKPFLDRDTKGIPGSPNIVDSILNKIDETDVFVADLTIVTDKNSPRAIPNPNVLIELGYAIKTLGLSRIILIMNTAYGEISSLPFDLHHLRIMPYALHQNQLLPANESNEQTNGKNSGKTPKSEQRQKLAKGLETAIRLIIEQHPKEAELQVINSDGEVIAVDIPEIEIIRDALEKESNPLKVSRILRDETDIIIEELNQISYFHENRRLGSQEIASLIVETDSAMTKLIETVSFGCAYGEPKYEKIWADNLTYLADKVAPQRTLDRLRLYPALVYFYAGGIAAVAEENYRNLAILLNKSKIRNYPDHGLPESVSYNLVPYRIIEEHEVKRLPVIGSYKIPISSHLHAMLYPKMNSVIHNEKDFSQAFIRFEYLFALSVAAHSKTMWGGAAIPVGSYFGESYLLELFSRKQPFITIETDGEINAQGEKWKPYEAGLIDLPWKEFLALKTEADENIIRQLRGYYPDLDVKRYSP